MNIFSKITLKNLTKNKVRTLVTIIGIILSAAMFTAVTTMIATLHSMSLQDIEMTEGNWFGLSYNTSLEDYTALKRDDTLAQVSALQNIGYAKISEFASTQKPYLYLTGADSAFLDTMPVTLIQGRLPEKSNEILLPVHFNRSLNTPYTVGDTITLSVGDRLLGDAVLTQNNPLMDDPNEGGVEVFTPRYENNYVVCGIYEQPSFEEWSAPGYTALTIMHESTNTALGYDVYLRTEKAKAIYPVLETLANKGYSTSSHTTLLMLYGASQYDNFYRVLYNFASIFILIIMFGSIALIYNAFAISINERTRQFGLLSSIGATKSQIRKSVFTEALLLSIASIPLGVISGILGIGITISSLGKSLESIFTTNVPFQLHVSFSAILISCALTLITVLISAWIPARRATKITAIEAIRQTRDIKINIKKTRTSKFTLGLFGLEGLLAQKYFTRNKKKYRVTVISLFMSIVLFISATAFTKYLSDSTTDLMGKRDYDISYSIDTQKQDQDALLKLFRNAPDVTAVNRAYIGAVLLENTDLLTSRYTQMLRDNGMLLTQEEVKAQDLDALSQITYQSPIVSFAIIDDDAYALYLETLGLDKHMYMNPEDPVAIVGKNVTFYSPEIGRFENFAAFQDSPFSLSLHTLPVTDDLSWDETSALTVEMYENLMTSFTLKVGYEAKTLPMGIGDSFSPYPYILIPSCLLDAVIPSGAAYLKSTASYFLSSSNHTNTTEKLESMFQAQGIDTFDLIDYAKQDEAQRGLLLVIQVFCYGFIILISLIAIANVFNTISTGISLRRRDFAMLKSTGLTQKGFTRMMRFESILYAVKSLLLGLPVSLLITYAMYGSISQGMETDFYIPWIPMLIAIISILLVISITTLYSMRKINKENIIDVLKNENI